MSTEETGLSRPSSPQQPESPPQHGPGGRPGHPGRATTTVSDWFRWVLLTAGGWMLLLAVLGSLLVTALVFLPVPPDEALGEWFGFLLLFAWWPLFLWLPAVAAISATRRFRLWALVSTVLLGWPLMVVLALAAADMSRFVAAHLICALVMGTMVRRAPNGQHLA